MAGRPLITGEKRKNKITLNLSDSMFTDIQDLSNLHGKTTGLYILELISKDIESQRTELKSFQDLRKKIAGKKSEA